MNISLESQLKNLKDISSQNAALNYLMPAIAEAKEAGFRIVEIVNLLAKHSIDIKGDTLRKRIYAYKKKQMNSPSPEKNRKQQERIPDIEQNEQKQKSQKKMTIAEAMKPENREAYAAQFIRPKSILNKGKSKK